MPLWDDILEVVQAYIEIARSRGRAPRSDELPVHFLGAVVVNLMPFASGQLELRQIIDGQQRLTTIQILIGAAVSCLLRFGATDQAEILSALATNRPSYLTRDEPDSIFKVWPTKHDRAAFRTVMSGQSIEGALEDHRIVRAYRFFEAAISEWAEGIPVDERDLHFQALDAVLRSQVHIVWIDLDGRDNAQVIFETLNDRGAPLNPIDLVKNLVFQRQSDEEETEELYEQYWAWIEDDWWQQRIRLGRLERVQADVFLQHWLQMRLCREINSDYLFKSFAKMLDSEAPDVKRLIPEFADDAHVYRSFSEQVNGTYRYEFFARLRILKTTTPLPLLLYLFKQRADVLSASSVDICLSTIEDYLVRRMLARGTTQGYNRLFTEVLSAVKQDPGRAPEIIKRQLSAMEGASRRWPRDAELLPILIESRAYGSGAIARERLLDVLWEVERHLRTSKHEQLDRPAGLQIEHIVPQSWERHWPLTVEVDRPQTERVAARHRAVTRLGNLTLVNDRLNPSLSNAGWAKKRDGLIEYSLLAMNRQLVDEYPDTFDEEAINARCGQLARAILSRWPGPPVGASD